MTQGSHQPAGRSVSPDTAPAFTRKARSGVLRPFSSLRQRNFRLFWFGQVLSLLGTFMQSIGQAWLVLQLTHSAWQLGLVGALQALPLLLLSLLGGVFADRWPKRSILLVTQPAAMFQAALLWVLLTTGVLQLWHLYVLAMLLGVTNSVGRPASQAFFVELVGREELPNAIALYFSASTLARIVGPGLGGIVIGAAGVPVLFLVNAISFVPPIAALILLRSGQLHAQPSEPISSASHSIWRRLNEGLDFVYRKPAIGLLILVVGLALLFGSNFNVVLPLFATDVLHVGATGFGFLSGATGVGALLAALWLAWGNYRPTFRRVLAGILVFGLFEVGFAVCRLYPLSLALIAAVGFAEDAFAAQAVTLLQTLTPDRLRGRVMSVQVLFFDGSLPLGYLLMGWLSALYGAAYALSIGAILTLAVVAVGWTYRRSAEENGGGQSAVQ